MRSIGKTVLALTAATFMSVGLGQAATINLSAVNGAWNSIKALPGTTNVTGLNTSSVSWGTPVGQPLQSGYDFSAAATGDHDVGVDFDLGTFTHRNQPIAVGTSIQGAGLGLVLNVVIGGVNQAIKTAFNFSHDETVNQPGGACANGANNVGVNVNGCADHVTILNNASSAEAFEIDGLKYILEITGFITGGALFTDFWTTEKANNSAVLRARFKLVGGSGGGGGGQPSPVPLPAAGWMILTGLGAIAAAKKARRKA